MPRRKVQGHFEEALEPIRYAHPPLQSAKVLLTDVHGPNRSGRSATRYRHGLSRKAVSLLDAFQESSLLPAGTLASRRLARLRPRCRMGGLHGCLVTSQI